MKVLITGGAGFIGQHLARFLLERDISVTILDNFLPQVHGPGGNCQRICRACAVGTWRRRRPIAMQDALEESAGLSILLQKPARANLCMRWADTLGQISKVRRRSSKCWLNLHTAKLIGLSSLPPALFMAKAHTLRTGWPGLSAGAFFVGEACGPLRSFLPVL